jgi:hypothetical protein
MRAMTGMGMSVVEVLPLVLLFVAVVALLAVSFGVVYIVRPLQELDRRAARVAWGDFDADQQPVGGVQEMDDLRATLADGRAHRTTTRRVCATTGRHRPKKPACSLALSYTTPCRHSPRSSNVQMAHKALSLRRAQGDVQSGRAANRLTSWRS